MDFSFCFCVVNEFVVFYANRGESRIFFFVSFEFFLVFSERLSLCHNKNPLGSRSHLTQVFCGLYLCYYLYTAHTNIITFGLVSVEAHSLLVHNPKCTWILIRKFSSIFPIRIVRSNSLLLLRGYCCGCLLITKPLTLDVNGTHTQLVRYSGLLNYTIATTKCNF